MLPTTLPLPVELESMGWKLLDPPAPPLEQFEACKQPSPWPPMTPRCDLACVSPETQRAMRRGQPRVNRSQLITRKTACTRCECQLCSMCSKPANQYQSPTGQTIETVTTRTDPRFIFAYNPYDDDMRRMRKTLILEPMLTHAWHEATAHCCNATGGTVIDVGGNFGWYTLYSLALGCDVTVFEPVPAYREIMQLGIALNPGFSKRVTLYGNVVYNQPGQYTLRVPQVLPTGRMKKLGMTGMDGSSGILKADWRAPTYNHIAASVRLDDVVHAPKGICMLKADVEGYEPQVLQTAQHILTKRRVPALQLELTRTPRNPNQTCAATKMLSALADVGFTFRQVSNKIVDTEAPRVGTWESTPGPWLTLPSFPTPKTLAAMGHLAQMRSARPSRRAGQGGSMQMAYKRDFVSFSTNLIALRKDSWECGPGLFRRCPAWPTLEC